MFVTTMRNLIVFILSLTLLLFTSCGNKKEIIPEDVIPREQMIDIVVDAWYLEAVIHNTIHDYDKIEVATVTYYAEFFEEHNITKEQFIKSIEYHMRDESTKQFIEDCSARFNERQEELTGVAAPVSQPQ